MSVVLYPRAVADTQPGAPSQPRLRVWVGVFDRISPPALRWFLEGDEVTGAEPVALRPIRSVRTEKMMLASDGVVPLPNVPRAFTGVYEFTKLAGGAPLAPDKPYRVGVKADKEPTVTVEMRTLPAEIPSALDRWFNVLLVSCFHQAEDRGGLAGSAIEHQLKSLHRPHLTLLLGDQVYLDLPPIKNFPDDMTELAAKFENDYTANWRGPEGYSKVLGVAPSVSVPDDHEYWNNFPHAATIIQNTWRKEGRARWRAVAEAMYEGFQLPAPASLGDAVMLDVPPLSFFMADTRSKQDENLQRALSERAFEQLKKWVKHVKAKELTGVFVTGQSVFREKPGRITGKVADYELPNYKDFDAILWTLKDLADAGRPFLCITGDVHWGRVLAARDLQRGGREMIYEIISSPSSLVSGVSSLVPRRFSDLLAGLRGDPWPRHSDASDPYFAHDVLGGRFDNISVKHRQKGNHSTLLSFRNTGGGVELRIKYLQIHHERQYTKVVDVDPLYLSRIV